jgi:hypothetical protein
MVDIFELAMSLRPKSYLSHASALFWHGLVGQIPAVVTVNQEQSPKGSHHTIASQEAIDRAFSRQQRATNYRFVCDAAEIAILNGKGTGRYGVQQLNGPTGRILEVTGLERTLVDIVVRPTYAGGVKIVSEAYRRAKDRLTIAKLIKTLHALDYVYPYHQAIGFWLQRAGIPPQRLEPLKKLGMQHKFYVDHGMVNPAYDENWGVYYPREL